MKKPFYLLLAAAALMMACHARGYSQDKIALKTNLVYWGSLTPNLGVEFGLNKKSTLSLSGGYNPWDYDNEKATEKLAHWSANAEYRHWFCERFNGHFVGAHLFGGQFNISEKKIPLIFDDKDADKSRYEGNMYGIGISYGYQIMLNKRFNVELTLGIGYASMKYDRYDCVQCGKSIDKNVSKSYFGPTKMGISLVYLIR